MVTANSILNKSEYPGLTKETILDFFSKKMESEGITDISMSLDEAGFRNEKFQLSFAGGKNKFSGFDKGCVKIEETGTTLNLKFTSSSRKTYLFFAKISLVLFALAFWISGFSLDSLTIGIAAFLIFSVEYTIHTFLNITMYFSSAAAGMMPSGL